MARHEKLARPTGFEPVTPEVINLGALTGLSYGRVVTSTAGTATDTSSGACGPSERFQGPSLGPYTANRSRWQGGAAAPHAPAFPPENEAGLRLLRSGPPHRCCPAILQARTVRQRESIGRLERRRGCRLGRRSSASGTASGYGQCEVEFMARSMPPPIFLCQQVFSVHA